MVCSIWVLVTIATFVINRLEKKYAISGYGCGKVTMIRFMCHGSHRQYMSFSLDVIDKLAALITAAFGLVAALAWNSAIQTFFKEIFGDQTSIPAMVGYAVFVTVIAVVFTLWIGFVSNKAKRNVDLRKDGE